MSRSPKKLDRLLRVRNLQLSQVQGEEARARARVEQESLMHRRIADLAANVAPVVAEPTSATSLLAAAHYRERLQHSAHSASLRVANAERGLEMAQANTREARRDQSAIEKLIDRAKGEQLRKEMRALEELPPAARNRHDIC